MNAKLQKVTRDIERARAKIAELEALLPGLEDERARLENDEVIKVFRSADVAPAEFTAFIEAYKSKLSGGARQSAQPAPRPNTMEVFKNEED